MKVRVGRGSREALGGHAAVPDSLTLIHDIDPPAMPKAKSAQDGASPMAAHNHLRTAVPIC